MSMTTFTVQGTLTTITCGVCGGIYAIAERYRQQKWEEGKSWNCPYCQTGWGYDNDNENSRLKKQIASLENQVTNIQTDRNYFQKESEHFRRSRDGIKGALTKVKKRVACGVCPCCRRNFQNLARHMANKHPHFVA